MNYKQLKLFSFFLLLIIPCPPFFWRDCSLLIAQTDTTANSSSRTDSLARTTLSQETKSFHPKKSPWLAVGLSAVAPGTGQLYNADYWKAPVIWGIGGYWVSLWIDLNKSYKNYGDQYTVSISTTQPEGNARTLQLRNFYRDERDKFAWYIGAFYLLNLVDAYVGANLYDFDVSPDLSADGKVSPKVTATIRLKF